MEQKRKHRAKMRSWLGAVCALALLCACISPRAAQAQDSAPRSSQTTSSKNSSSKTSGGKPKSKTASPKKHAQAAAKQSRASASTPAAKAHPASHPAAGTHRKSHTAIADRGSKSKYAASRKNSKRKTARGQQKIEPERAQAIQEALIREHYLTGEAVGTWNQASEDAMRRYQADHGWQSKTVPDARALISLGLGPSHDHLLNPESAMTTEPESPHAAALTPASHSADPGAQTNPNPPVAPTPATTPQHDSSSPQ